MNIGMTFDLRSDYILQGYDEKATAEFDRPDTIDAIDQTLTALGHTVDRIGHCKSLVKRLAAGQRWDLVFNICEGMYGFGREAQVPALLDVYAIPYTFADPLVMSVCLHKGVTKALLAAAGIPTPKSQLFTDGQCIACTSLRFPVFAKPVAEGTSKGVSAASRCETPAQLEAICRSLLDEFGEPVLAEEYLPGREFTVGLLGTGESAYVLGTLEIVMQAEADPDVYTYRNKEECESLVEYRLVSAAEDPTVAEAESLALKSWRALNCRDAGRVDLRCNLAGEPELLEVNPLAGLHPSHSDLPMLATALGIEYIDLIRRILDSACQRVQS